MLLLSFSAAGRLYFDARGEVDLRDPVTSTLAVVELDPLKSNSNNCSAWMSHHGSFDPDGALLYAGKPGHFKVS